MSNTSSSKVNDTGAIVSSHSSSPNDGINNTILQKSDMVANMSKTSMGTLLLLISFLVASIWLSDGTGWIYDSSINLSPLTSCVSAWDYQPFEESGFCAVDIFPWSPDMYNQILYSGQTANTTQMAKQEGLCVLPMQDASKMETGSSAAEHALQLGPISCYSRKPCAQTTDWTVLNPYSVSSVMVHETQTSCSLSIGTLRMTVECFQIYSVEAFCDGGFNVNPAGIVAIRGLLFGIIVLWLCLLGKDLYLYLKIASINRGILKYRQSVIGQTIAAERQILLDQCLSKWDNTKPMMGSRVGTCLSLVSSSGGSTPVGGTPSSGFRLPCQPILSQRQSIVTDFKSATRGYSPRLGSTPAMLLANGIGKDGLFQSGWRKKVGKYFKQRETNIESVTFLRSNLIFNFILYSILIIGFFVLLFRLVLAIVTLPLVTGLPGGQSLTYLLSLTDLTPSAIFGVIADDATGNNAMDRPVLFMWVDFIAYGDLVLETVLLLIPACLALLRPTNLKWVDKTSFTKPSEQQHAADDSGLLDEDFSNNRFGFRQDEDSGGSSPVSVLSDLSPRKHPNHTNNGLVRSISAGNTPLVYQEKHHEASGALVCVLVSVCSPCVTEESKEAFVANLKSIRSIVESDCDIFVVDCGSNKAPLDNTEFVIQSQVSSKIHYVYFPENNRILSLYWTSKYWIPFTFSSGLCGDYMYSLIVDESIRFPATFTLPTSEFFEHNPKIKAMYIPMNERIAKVSPSWVSQWKEQIDLVAIFQMTGSTLHAGEDRMPQIWERNAFEMTCFNIHLPIAKPMEPLCLKLNGRLLLKERGNSKMVPWISGGRKPFRISAAYGPYNGGCVTMMSFRKNLTEIINPSSFLHWPSFIGKYAIFVEIVNVFYDTLRFFLLGAMLLRDPVGLAIVSIICALIATIPYEINLLMNLQYQDRKIQRALFLLFLYPITLLFIALPSRALRVFKQKTFALAFRKYETDVSIGEREEEFRDLPIVPPHPSPHWSTVWYTSH